MSVAGSKTRTCNSPRRAVAFHEGALERTVDWYRAQTLGADLRAHSMSQIEDYANAA